MKTSPLALIVAVGLLGPAALQAEPLGLPKVPIPADNPPSTAKIALGHKLYNDTRFSRTGKVGCVTCHDPAKGFTDRLPVSKGVDDLTGTRNAPTVINAAYNRTQFWDGREPDLEGQSKQPLVNPVEHGMPDHAAVVAKVRADRDYVAAFKRVFGVDKAGITIDHVAKAIASFERTVVAGDSPFDRWFYGGEAGAMNAAQIRGYELFINRARCVSCHTIEQDQALFTDHRFHNIGTGFSRIQDAEAATARAFLERKRGGADVDVTVLTDANMSELGRFAVSENLTQIGAFKTSTLRNVALTAPYMHDGSLATLKEVIEFYNNGGRVKERDPVSGFQSGGIRPLGLSEAEVDDLVAFLEALTSPRTERLGRLASN